jgi:hypothetical protein
MGIPEWLKEYKDERLSLTVQLCLAWEEANGGEGAIFKLSCRQLAEFLSQSGNDADFRMAAMYLKLLCGIGFLVLEKKGDRYQGGEASKYRIFHRGG